MRIKLKCSDGYGVPFHELPVGGVFVLAAACHGILRMKTSGGAVRLGSGEVDESFHDLELVRPISGAFVEE